MRAFKNLRLAKKLVLSFLIIALIAALIGGVGIWSMSTLSHADEQMYNFNTKPMSNIAVMYDTLASQRICANNMVIFLTDDPQFSQDESQSLIEKEMLFDEAFREYKSMLSTPEEIGYYQQMETLYYNDFAAIKQSVRAAVASGDTQAMVQAIAAMDSLGSEISGYMDKAFALNDQLASDQVQSNKSLSASSTVMLIVVMGVGVLLSMLLAVLLTSLITKPLNRVLSATKQVGLEGDLNVPEQITAQIRQDAVSKDEMGQFAKSFSVMMQALIDKTRALETVASGDLTAEVHLISQRDTIGNALSMMLQNLNAMFGEINGATVKVAVGSRQIADGAQSLAQGSTEQAAAVEELSTSIGAVSVKTQENAQMAGDAADLAQVIKDNAEKSRIQMQQMIQAVEDINQASENINKVIKVIDDIAFQTNILALNANIEAARVGIHGRGFAVVAEEVRSLAAKSAEAAKNTDDMIADSMEKARLGSRIARATAGSLDQIVEDINRSARIVQDIARSSADQNEAIMQINRGIEQVAQVVQQNSATAQQSAASSQEMSVQSDTLDQLIAQFRIRELDGQVSAAPAQTKIPERSYAQLIPPMSEGLGKY